MSIRINNIILDIEEDTSILKEKAAKRLKLPINSIKDFKILKESIDARKKDSIKFNYTVEISCDNESKVVSKSRDKDVKIEEVKYNEEFKFGDKELDHRPVIIGMGPAGMFAGLLMAQKGYNPIIIERGESVEHRSKSIDTFWNSRVFNKESNVQFGEGGAGTFSDGKLTTRIKDSRCDFVLEEFVKGGAPEEILYMGKPHIGTDILKEVVKSIRHKIIELGGEVHFNSKLEDILTKDNKIKSIIVNGREIPCEALVLAIGHSARDTYQMLFNKNIAIEPKPFAIGVRIEHLQSMIDENQYGKFAGHKRLRAADYRLAHNTKGNRGVYSFCMCPGGYVVAAASEEERVVVNGMSYYKRDGKNANSAIVVSVTPDDFGNSSPLAGMEFQRHYESLAYNVGGREYLAPVQLLGDFLEDRRSKKIGNIEPTYKPGYTLSDLKECLPSYVVESLKEGVVNFDKKIKGFADKNAVLTGIETRTSAPIRILRNKVLQSISIEGLYPAGEGAGYAGGIMSAAVDGLKVAEAIMKNWAPF
ncbi:NAD(P)/FAD-dependent oxidoreductase [Clostridium lundense]|uniref:NAD(P)/FAD-dependent oxidoreductase n=1 Tax=Clostridium lundense TaxID=319475 RepID=UPI000487F803|nr:NAD(P)/FAD-dependent oxidoreductase [Clostridium lundense]